MPPRREIYTIGHSTRSAEQLVELLHAHGVRTVADVRRFAASRRHPHFAAAEMARWLPEAGVRYVPMPGLGGRRNPVPRSPNTGLRSSAFRGYADYMQTTEFQQAIDELIELATMAPTAVMCAEAVPWRCHRWLIGDALLVRGWRVMDIISADRATERQLSATARPQGTRLTYPPADQLPGLAAGA